MGKTSNILYPVYAREKTASIDAKFGPWSSAEDAIYNLNKMDALAEGLEIGIKQNGVTKRYYFQGGVTSAHLVPVGCNCEETQGGSGISTFVATDKKDNGIDLDITLSDGRKVTATIPVVNGLKNGVLTPNDAQGIVNAINKANEALRMSNLSAQTASEIKQYASNIEELLTQFAMEGTGDGNVTAQVVLNTGDIALLKSAVTSLQNAVEILNTATGSSVQIGTYEEAYAYAQANGNKFQWLLNDTINGIALLKPIWHVGDYKFVDAIGCQIEKEVVKPEVTLLPAGGKVTFPVTINASSVFGADIYMNGAKRNSMTLTEPGTVDAYAVLNGIQGDTVTGTYSEQTNTGLLFDNGLKNGATVYAPSGYSPMTLDDSDESDVSLVSLSGSNTGNKTAVRSFSLKPGETAKLEVRAKGVNSTSATYWMKVGIANYSGTLYSTANASVQKTAKQMTTEINANEYCKFECQYTNTGSTTLSVTACIISHYLENARVNYIEFTKI